VNAIWTIPPSRMKTNEAFSVPLGDRAVEIVADARRMARKEPTADGFVFFGVVPKKPLSNMALAMLLRRMDVHATASAHGFRTSFRTWCSDVAHTEFEVAEACLSHRIGSIVSRAYARSDMLESATGGDSVIVAAAFVLAISDLEATLERLGCKYVLQIFCKGFFD
jgi:integrase